MGKKSKSTKPPKFQFKGFQNILLTSAEKQALADWIDAFSPEVLDSLVVLVESNWKVSTAYDDYHEVYSVSATCKASASKYFGWCFTMKHADLGRAICIMRRIYETMLADGLYSLEGNSKLYDW